MVEGKKIPLKQIFISLFIFSLICGSINQIDGYPLSTNATLPVQIYQVASSLYVYQNDQLRVSVSVTNTDVFDIPNLTISANFHSDLEFLFSSEPTLDSTIGNDPNKFSHHFGMLYNNSAILFSITFNVTSSERTDITIPSMNVSYILLNGIEGYLFTNDVDIFLAGVEQLTEVPLFPQIPKGKIKPNVVLTIGGYMLPVVIFGLSAFIMRRKRKK
jgi:hypothetical protein